MRMVLLLIQCAERCRSQSREIIIRQIIRHRNAFDDYASKLLALLFRDLLEFAKNLGDCLCHVLNIHGRNEARKRQGANREGQRHYSATAGPC